MEVKILKETDEYLEIQLDGEDHTLGNLLKGMLLMVPGVKFASYTQPHPLIDSIIIKTMTDGSIKPRDALKKAIELAENYANKFIDEVKSVEKGN
ncbi:DNA-directed RNA polymerase subunit L [Stygiolobus caldivivus]|uniref:DNA-directed RNA polymerase subunit Rpo11 n=1 Tax=Stygiolobus caldivivus TaxID=2824673 RepID=A0A8D5U577_9CREN|nr:DNA-directed RNA polymerase subunit L [Stygiolobus caldivivus]BCU69477.1 DNA-directed RNA polymerase subunit L [Stygiolobus caldivivus]